MSQTITKFFCSSCNRGYVWKPEQAGKRTKCKCGAIMAIPAQPPQPEPPAEPAPAEDDMYDLAEPPPQKPVKAPPLAAAAPPTGGVPLAYQSAPTARQKARTASRTIIDPRRDYYVPVALLLSGVVLYNAYYAIHYQLNLPQLSIVSLGLAIMGVLETTILVSFALMAAGPLGVSFGGVWTAILKLAAIAIFSDGVIAWVDGYVQHISGGFGTGIIGFPVALGVYWVSLIYLFSMDPGDSWFVVVLLSVFYRIVSIALLLLLLNLIFSFGHVRGIAATALASGSGGAPPPPSYTMQEYKDAEAKKVLVEARQYAIDQKLTDEVDFIDRWYKAGAKKVSYELVPVGIGSTGIGEVFIELPADDVSRAKCVDVARTYYLKKKITYDPKDLKDTGDPYLLVGFDYCPVAPEADPDNGN